MQAVTGKHGLSYGYLGDGAQMWRLFYTLYKQHDADFDLSGPTRRGRRGRRGRRRSSSSSSCSTARSARPSGDYGTAVSEFMSGESGMFFTGVWELPTAKNAGHPRSTPSRSRRCSARRRPTPTRTRSRSRTSRARTRSSGARRYQFVADLLKNSLGVGRGRAHPGVPARRAEPGVPGAPAAGALRAGRRDPQLRPGGVVHRVGQRLPELLRSRPSRASTSTAPTRRRASTPSSAA